MRLAANQAKRGLFRHGHANYAVYQAPWPHAEIDSLLIEEDWKWLQGWLANHEPKLAGEHDQFTEPHTMMSGGSALYRRLAPYVWRVYDGLFEELNFSAKRTRFGEAINAETCTPFVQVNSVPARSRYGCIHTEALYKMMTTTLFVSPQKCNGTELYRDCTDNRPEKECSWKPNNALAFVGNGDAPYPKTWHDYQNTSAERRVTLNLILADCPDPGPAPWAK